ncbi:MAG: aldo/keto reductase [Lacunisphaera sp.]|nr:aldo/keto reductase [Lacunisphaera sp.]
MNRTQLPGTGLSVSPLCLGVMSLGTTIPEGDCFALLDRFVALGGNFLDTARIYSDWEPGEKRRSERILGDWLQARGHRVRLVLATKGAHAFIESLQTPRTSAAEIRDDLEGSLRTLRTDIIDLYWLHRDDVTRPVGHFVDLLNTFVREGKIRTFGGSNWSAARLRGANDYAKKSGQQGFSANQPLWCLGSAQARPFPYPGLLKFDPAAYQFHRETGLAVVPYTAQAKGFYTKLARPPADLTENIFHTPPNVAAAAVAGGIAQQRGVNLSAIVLAYLWSRPFPVIPIVGCRTIAQLDDCVAALSVRLTAAELAALESASQSGLPAEI